MIYRDIIMHKGQGIVNVSTPRKPCSATATLMQRHCNADAVPPRHLCSVTATGIAVAPDKGLRRDLQ